MAIQYIGQATGITSATLPAHQANDIIIAFAFRDGSALSPTMPAGWTSLSTQLGTTTGIRAAYIRATNGSTVSGTWTNATSVVFHIYRNVTSIGRTGVVASTGTTVGFSALTLVNANGLSWVAGFVGHASNNVAITAAPSGMVNRSSVSDFTDEAAGHDTNGGVSSFGSRTAFVGGTSAQYISFCVELTETPVINATATPTAQQASSSVGSATSTGTATGTATGSQISSAAGTVNETATANTSATGIQSTTQIGSVITRAASNVSLTGKDLLITQGLLQPLSTWYSFFFDTKILVSNADALYAQSGQQADISAESITAIIEVNQLITGQEAQTEIETIIAIGDANIISESIEINSFAESITAGTGADELITGQEAQAQIQDISASGFASIIVDGLATLSELGTIVSTADSNTTAESVDATSAFGELNYFADANTSASGLELTSAFGIVTATSESSTNAITVVQGLELQSYVSSVTANGKKEEIISGISRPKRYPASQFKNNTVKISGISTKITVSRVSALGIISISGTAMVQDVGLYSEVQTVSAEGILSISEDELILLLAA